MKIWSMILKNFKLLIRSKFSASVVILGPLIIVLLVGAAFNTSSVNNIRVGVYAPAYTELTTSVVNAIEKNPQFKVLKLKTEQDCLNDIVSGAIHVCLQFPENFKEAVEGANIITFNVDNSRINIVYLLIDSISSEISVKTTELSQGLTQVLIDSLDASKSAAAKNKESLTVMSSDNEGIKTKSSNIQSSLDSITFNINKDDYNLTDIIENIESQCSNCSIEELNDIQTSLTSLTNQILELNNKTALIKADVQIIKTTAESNTQKITDLQTSFESTISSIDSIQVKEAGSIATPIKTKINPISQDKKNWNFLFPTLVALIIMFVSILLATTLVMREKNTAAYFRNFITPTGEFTFIIGTFLTCLIILVFQLAIIFGQAAFFLKNELILVILMVIVSLLIIASTFILLGMMLGYAFKSEETSILAAMSVSAFLLFFSNTILPIETIPPSMSWIASFNPFVVADSVLKKLLLFKGSFSSIATELYVLLSYFTVFLILTFLTRQITKRRLGQ